ncbi:glycosyltransferase family 4 protein [Lignipirellula cremea]|uniref:Spore coat protein SA n=1 Tax=Lignipirellula cremea TaxID=2528010 RepID=A0A518E4P0_9BACT|nr:glycosyltransferase family 4 protein [Lignipirellula cremea]QDU99038.1 Spore coat protein SA [Lignipirellula cremea]
MKTKIGHLTCVHTWNDTRIYLKQCTSLYRAGFDVSLIACTDEVDFPPEGAKIVPVRPSRNRAVRMLTAPFRVIRAALRGNCDLYHFHDPELIPAGVVLKLLGKRVVYDSHEVVPDQILGKYWIPKFLRRPVSRAAALLEKIGVWFFDGVVAATPSIADHFPQGKTATVQNFPILDELAQPHPSPFRERPPRVLYVGAVSSLRGVTEVVQAMSHLPEDLDAEFTIAGGFRPQSLLTELESHEGWKRVDFRGWCSREQVAECMGQSRVGVVTFLPAPNHIAAQPNKLFEYMSAALPVVASDFPLWRAIVEEAGCGLLVDPEDPQQIAEAIRWLIENPEEAEAMGLRGRRAIEDRYRWDREFETLQNFYAKLLNKAEQGREPLVCQSGGDDSGDRRAA